MSRISTAPPPIDLRIARLPTHDPALPLPAYESRGAAGMDLRACLADRGSAFLSPGGRQLVPTGLSIAIPEGFEGQVRPRSGLALRHGITVANAPGTIDSDYRGELGVLLVNLGHEPVLIVHGDRIAQLVIAPVRRVRLEEVATLDATERAEGGFGSTGSD